MYIMTMTPTFSLLMYYFCVFEFNKHSYPLTLVLYFHVNRIVNCKNVNIEYHCVSIETCWLHGRVKPTRQRELSEDSMTSRQI